VSHRVDDDNAVSGGGAQHDVVNIGFMSDSYAHSYSPFANTAMSGQDTTRVFAVWTQPISSNDVLRLHAKEFVLTGVHTTDRFTGTAAVIGGSATSTQNVTGDLVAHNLSGFFRTPEDATAGGDTLLHHIQLDTGSTVAVISRNQGTATG